MSNENSSINFPLSVDSKKRSRNFSLITYLSKEDIQEVLSFHTENIKAYAYILHDKDNKENHVHLILSLYNATTALAVCKWFRGYVDISGKDINTLCQCMHDKCAGFSYLTHENAKDKYQYDYKDIVGYNQEFFLDSEEYKVDSISMALEDLLSGVSVRTLCKRYGRDFIIHSRSILSVAEMIHYEESQKTSILNRSY